LDLETFLRRIPKVELHCHLEGAVKAATFVELAAKHQVALPSYREPEDLYAYDNILDFLKVYALIVASLRDRDDFARITYEALADAAANGLRYSELFYSPVDFLGSGVPYRVMLDGIIAGLRAAQQDLGVECRLIACLTRMVSPAVCTEVVQQVLDERREEVIGIGIGGAEPGRPPEWFVEAYRLAARGGLHRTAHACEDGPAVNVQTCLDLLGCERIDHGYHVLEDEAITQRCAEQGVVFTVCPTSTAQVYGWRDLSRHPIRAMVSCGLKVMVNSDDPPMFGTDLGREYVVMAEHMGFTPQDFKQFVLNGIDGSWLDESTKRRWRQEWVREIDSLMAQLD